MVASQVPGCLGYSPPPTQHAHASKTQDRSPLLVLEVFLVLGRICWPLASSQADLFPTFSPGLGHPVSALG